ncbi:hypothetical protein WDJ51_00645 [Rathayibacter sp. YIM 133350]
MPGTPGTRNELENPVLDIIYIAGVLALVALLALVTRGVEKL